MKGKEELIEWTKEIIDYNDYDQLLEKVVGEIDEHSETLGDIVTPVKSTLKILTLAKKIKFKKFLQVYSRTVNSSINLSEEKVSRLNKYLSKEKNFEFVAEIIDSAIFSKSSLSSSIMGFIAGKILSKEKEITYQDIIALNSLKIMVNEDITNFIQLYDFVSDNYNREKTLRIYDLKEDLEESLHSISTFELELTIEKLKNVQALSYDVGGMSNLGNAWGTFKINQNTDYLYEIIKNSRVI
jgi:hypothetical protein